eukprot:NP_494546.1 Uncharacterized protein CELE_C16C8.13 [Caenorhabditis elegans]
MSEPSSLMTEFQKLRVETSKIQNEFREKPGYVEDKLHKNTLEMCQKILKKQHGFQKTQENQNKFIEHLILDLESVKKETSDMKKQQETQILKRQDEYHDEMKQEFQKIQATQNKLIEDLMNSDKNLEMMLKIQEGQNQMMMKIMQRSAVHDVPIETGELAKNVSFFYIFVYWSDSHGTLASGNYRNLWVRGSDTIRQVKLTINSLANVDISSFRMVLRDKVLEDDHTLAYYNIQEGSTLGLFSP